MAGEPRCVTAGPHASHQSVRSSSGSDARRSVVPGAKGVRVTYLASAGTPMRIAPYPDSPRPGAAIGERVATDGILARRPGYAFVQCRPQLQVVAAGHIRHAHASLCHRGGGLVRRPLGPRHQPNALAPSSQRCANRVNDPDEKSVGPRASMLPLIRTQMSMQRSCRKQPRHLRGRRPGLAPGQILMSYTLRSGPLLLHQ